MEVGPERRLGQLLLERDVLSQEKLFQQLQRQVEHIFFATLLARGGSYFFIVPNDEAEPPVHTVHLAIQALLMEGVQRIDEMALFRERIPNNDLCPLATMKAASMSLDDTSSDILRLSDGQNTIEEIARQTGLGEFMTIKNVYGLLQQGGVLLQPKKAVDPALVRDLVDSFNSVLRDIFMAVATYGGIDQTRSTLEAWIAGSGYGPLFGDHMEEDGTIRYDRVLHAVEASGDESPMAGLHQALHELSAFALFAATTALPREQELALSRDVNSRLKRIRI